MWWLRKDLNFRPLRLQLSALTGLSYKATYVFNLVRVVGVEPTASRVQGERHTTRLYPDIMAPSVGIEPTALTLTGSCSTDELTGNILFGLLIWRS